MDHQRRKLRRYRHRRSDPHAGQQPFSADEEQATLAFSAQGPMPLIQADAEVECRLVLRFRCPFCGQRHAFILGRADHLSLPGDHLWQQTCHGERFIVQAAPVSFADALRRAEGLTAGARLNDAWLGARVQQRADANGEHEVRKRMTRGPRHDIPPPPPT